MNLLRFSLILAWSGLLILIPQNSDAQSRLDKRLLQKISVQMDSRPVEDVLRELGEKHQLEVVFDPSVAGGQLGKFSLTADGMTLGSVIHLVCESASLIFSVEKGRLLVTTREAEEANLFNREYALAPLRGAVDPQFLAANLVGLTSGHWNDVDGEGGEFVAISPQSLTIRQTRAVHAELQTLFDQIAAAATGRARPLTAQERADQLIVRKLQTPSLVAADQTALPDLLDNLLKKNGVPYWIDMAALADEGIDWTQLNSTVDARKVAAARRLDAIASEHKLSWRVAGEVVQITAAAKADEQMSCRVYDVRRLISPNRPIDLLMEQLTSNEELGPWQITEGEGGSLMPIGTLLVIRQNARTHARIAKLLN